ncbi:MAG: STAS domain-containing protein [Acidimicrobiales bacterium]
MNLGVDVQRRGEWVVITPLGDVDMGSAPGLRQEVIRTVAAGDTRIVFDLGSVDFIDSVGLGVVIGALRRTRANGGDVVLARVPDSVAEVLALVELDRILTIHADIDDAVAS